MGYLDYLQSAVGGMGRGFQNLGQGFQQFMPSPNQIDPNSLVVNPAYGVQPAPQYGQHPTQQQGIPYGVDPAVPPPPVQNEVLPMQNQPPPPGGIASAGIQPVPEYAPFPSIDVPGREYEGEVGDLLQGPLSNEQVEMQMYEMMGIDPLQAKFPGIGPGQGMYDTPENVYQRDYEQSTEDQWEQARKAARNQMFAEMGGSLLSNIGNLSGAMGEMGGAVSKYQGLLGGEESFREARRTGQIDEAAKMLELKTLAQGKPRTETQVKAEILDRMSPEDQQAYLMDEGGKRFTKFGDLGLIDLDTNTAHFSTGSFEVGSPEYQAALEQARKENLARAYMPYTDKMEPDTGPLAGYGPQPIPAEERKEQAESLAGLASQAAGLAGDLPEEVQSRIAFLQNEMESEPEMPQEEVLRRVEEIKRLVGGGTL